MKQNDDTLTIDLYAAPKRPAVADGFHLDLDDDLADTGKAINATVAAFNEFKPADVPTPKTFHSVKELDTAAQELAVIPENTNRRLAAISENMISLAVDLGIDASISTQDMIKEAAHDMANAATLLVRTGVRLTIAKEQCQHGEFENLCRQVGMQPQRAREAMSYAEFASSLDPKERDKYLMLPKRSALLLANAEPALVEFLLEDGNEELARKLRKRSELVELARELTETEDALNRHARENEALHKELKALREANDVAVAGSEYPAVVVQLRKEASVLTDEAIAALSSIRHHVDNFDYLGITGSPEQDERNRCAALFPAIANVASILTAANTLLQDLTRKHDVDLSTVAGFVHVAFDDSELIMIEAAREMMLSRKKGKSALRQAEYANSGELMRGRGRPSKAI